ncbi:HNH endonuclease [Pseudohalioglobus lutimaris]|uniref:Restriction endonuclease n=1 Tax=Pseudohalioglobus lutimaris TaxID=1737061 RepID=A0A2N5WXC8_9GAMM|nr:restriction endonuclease [Pseudohalioglobus lutimaris]
MPKSKRRKSLKKPRTRAFHNQSGLCYYCQQPMWLTSPTELTVNYGITHRRAMLLRCTGEHLIAHAEGGGSNSSNIVAACLYCNRQRHRRRGDLPPARFRDFVRKRMKQGRWHMFCPRHLEASVSIP